ncbi:hypothetical protein BJ322DRAFT_853339 [Thelephora terrestris]|uniref:F-box domain-containing protein n=1 Tax=Thelephora terrestris TaxID=56493 RepID=A0A9P6HD24_9AGAM|nr:hypothetical protein BJ322DRAFT_853339 [Thelephora terrestris]
METYPGSDLTTEQLLDALFRRVDQQRSVCDRNVRNQDFRLMVSNQEKVLSKLLYEIRKMCSSTNVASSAPAEVITKIAMEGLLLVPWQCRDLISMSHVCKSWREAVISYPLLWNAILGESEMVTRMCLERSKTLPLRTVSLIDFDRWSNSTMQLLGSHATRFEILNLDDTLPIPDDPSKILTDLIPGEGSILRELSLTGNERHNTTNFMAQNSLRSPIVFKDIPTLRKITLSSFPLIPQLSVLRHLTDFELDAPWSTPVSDLLDLLANNPHLEIVTITSSRDNGRTRRKDLSIALPHLRHLDVFDCETIDLLRCLHLPRLEGLKIEIRCSFDGATLLPEAYQPYSIIQLARDLGFSDICLHTSPKFYLQLGVYLGELIADFGELPPKTAEVLGPSTVRLIKHLRLWEARGRLDYGTPKFDDALHHMERLETLALDYLPASLVEILSILNDVVRCPLLRTLIVRFPEGVIPDAEEGSLVDVVRSRAEGGNSIRRLRVIVSSEEHVGTCSLTFGPFVQEVEILVCQPGERDGRPWLVWED